MPVAGLPMMNVIKLIADLKAEGCTVRAELGKIKATGTLTPVLRGRIQEHKQDLLHYLAPGENYGEAEPTEEPFRLDDHPQAWAFWDRCGIALARAWREGNLEKIKQAMEFLNKLWPEAASNDREQEWIERDIACCNQESPF